MRPARAPKAAQEIDPQRPKEQCVRHIIAHRGREAPLPKERGHHREPDDHNIGECDRIEKYPPAPPLHPAEPDQGQRQKQAAKNSEQGHRQTDEEGEQFFAGPAGLQHVVKHIAGNGDLGGKFGKQIRTGLSAPGASGYPPADPDQQHQGQHRLYHLNDHTHISHSGFLVRNF